MGVHGPTSRWTGDGTFPIVDWDGSPREFLTVLADEMGEEMYGTMIKECHCSYDSEGQDSSRGGRCRHTAAVTFGFLKLLECNPFYWLHSMNLHLPRMMCEHLKDVHERAQSNEPALAPWKDPATPLQPLDPEPPPMRQAAPQSIPQTRPRKLPSWCMKRVSPSELALTRSRSKRSKALGASAFTFVLEP